MNTFLYAMIFLLSLSAIVKFIWVKDGDMPERTVLSEVSDIIVNLVLAVWAVFLLGGCQ